MINATYNYLPVNIQNSKPVKYQNKKADVKSTYNNIINISRNSPIYLLNMTNSTRYYALSIKQNAMELGGVMQQMESESEESFLDSKAAVSSHPDIIDATLVNTSTENLPPTLKINVKQLATSQVNTGREFSYDSKPLKPGTHQFAIHVQDNLYEFQYNALQNSTSKDNQEKLVDFINQADIGIKASFINSSKGSAGRIHLESSDTGSSGEPIFTLEDRLTDSMLPGVVETFELDTLTSFPKNSIFLLNGDEKNSLNNSICLNKALNITLKKTSDETVHIELKANKEDIMGGLSYIVDSYNNMIQLGNNYNKEQLGARKLVHEINHLASQYKNDLESCGLNLSDNNEIKIDESLAIQAADDGDLKNLLSTTKGFVRSIINKASDITLNPMQYLDKTIVYYKNPTKQNFANPYMTSIYSGMMFNYYC